MNKKKEGFFSIRWKGTKLSEARCSPLLWFGFHCLKDKDAVNRILEISSKVKRIPRQPPTRTLQATDSKLAKHPKVFHPSSGEANYGFSRQ
jgi:hypothetical protein